MSGSRRRAWRSPAAWLQDFWRDLALAVRGLRRRPGFALFVIATLGLGVGANSAMFGLLDRLLLSPPPYIARPGQVSRLLVDQSSSRGTKLTMSTTSYASFVDLRDGTRSFSRVAAASTGPMIMGRGEGAHAVKSAKVSGGYFALLGVHAIRGRLFGEEDDRPPAGNPVAVLAYGFWQRSFGGDAAALGSRIELDGRPFTVIGVLPAGFTGDELEPLEVWVPLNAGLTGLPPDWREDKGLNLVSVLARRRPGVTAAAAAADASLVYRHGMEGERFGRSELRILLGSLIPGRGPEGASTQGRITLWLSGVSLVVLLIAVANVTNLLLLRAAQRRQEVAVRLALGMRRSRLAQQCLTESLLLAALGGAVGLLIARWGGDLVRSVLLPALAPEAGFASSRVLLVTAAAALGAGLFSGAVPALQAAAPSLVETLRGGPQAGGSRRSALRTVLLVAQTALSVVLLAGAGLFVRSLHNVRSQDLGFSTQHLLLATLQFRPDTPGRRQDEVYRQGVDQLRRVPGVELAVPIDAIPFGPSNVPALAVPGVDLSRFPQMPFLNAATPEYFRVMDIRLLRGRAFTAADNRTGEPVVLVSETMARSLWPGQEALGRCIRFGFTPDAAAVGAMPCRQVVGIVHDVRPRSIRPEAQTIMQYYAPYEQLPPPPFAGMPTISGLLIRAAGEPAALAGPVERALQSFAADLPHAEVRPYQDLIDPQIRPWQLGAAMFTTFGGLALVMAAIGLYGVLAYVVAQRIREMGIRLALGAARGDLMRLVLGQGLRWAALGIVLGGAVALLAGRFVAPLLFAVSAHDPVVLGGVALLLALVAMVASLVPAWRATRAQPSLALKEE
jgi:putative ABC transport system permease protein